VDDRGMPVIVYVVSWTAFQFSVCFLLPVAAVCVAYWLLYRRLTGMPVIGPRSAGRATSATSHCGRSRLTKTVVVVVATFVVCQAPYHAMQARTPVHSVVA